jgi:hypothetical protein
MRSWREIARELAVAKDRKAVLQLAGELAAALDEDDPVPYAPFTGRAKAIDQCSEPSCGRGASETIDGNHWCEYHAKR